MSPKFEKIYKQVMGLKETETVTVESVTVTEIQEEVKTEELPPVNHVLPTPQPVGESIADAIKQEVVKEAIKESLVNEIELGAIKRQKLTLVTPETPFDDKTPLTLESICGLGFQAAPKEDFIGAGDKTFFVDLPNAKGRTTIVYDFQPIGNQGRPAAHVYFNSNDTPITEALVCFSATATLGEVRQLLEAAQNLSPSESKNKNDIKTVKELIEQIRIN